MAAANDSREPTGAMTSNSFILSFINVVYYFAAAKLRKKSNFEKQFWRINATKYIDKGISRKYEAIRSGGSTQIWEDCGKS